MTPTGKCFGCKAPILGVFLDNTVRYVDAEPDRAGTVEIRLSGGAWRGRYIGSKTYATPNWTKVRTHNCPPGGAE